METAAAPLFAVPQMMVQLALASCETMGHRLLLMAQGACTTSEYQLMAFEKAEALQLSTLALLTGRGGVEVVQPYLQRAQHNASRLRAVRR
jgi:hypothetical protein